jgi:hypothetical protein
MKTVSYDTEVKASKAHADEVLPLKLPPECKLQKDECVVFKLPTTPTDAASPTYEYTVTYLDASETEDTHSGFLAAIFRIPPYLALLSRVLVLY